MILLRNAVWSLPYRSNSQTRTKLMCVLRPFTAMHSFCLHMLYSTCWEWIGLKKTKPKTLQSDLLCFGSTEYHLPCFSFIAHSWPWPLARCMCKMWWLDLRPFAEATEYWKQCFNLPKCGKQHVGTDWWCVAISACVFVCYWAQRVRKPVSSFMRLLLYKTVKTDILHPFSIPYLLCCSISRKSGLCSGAEIRALQNKSLPP